MSDKAKQTFWSWFNGSAVVAAIALLSANWQASLSMATKWGEFTAKVSAIEQALRTHVDQTNKLLERNSEQLIELRRDVDKLKNKLSNAREEFE